MVTYKNYESLGLSPDANENDIKKAYRKLAMENHPDKGGDPEKFKEISNAYAVLSDPEKKRQYDQFGDDGDAGNGISPHDINEMFSRMFNNFGGGGFDFGMGGMGMGMGQQKRNSIMHNINVTLNDVYFGVKKVIKISVSKNCFKCQRECGQCQGRGQITDMRRMGFITQMMTRPCDKCQGSGMSSSGSCGSCVNGKKNEEKKVEIDIPKGVQSGYQIVIEGFGEQPVRQNEIPGDIIININVQGHNLFERRDADLLFNSSITFSESVLGKVITIPHFGGDINIDTSRFTIIQPEKKYIIEGKGLPVFKGSHSGNLILQFNIKYPTKKWTPEQYMLLKTTFDSVGLTN